MIRKVVVVKPEFANSDFHQFPQDESIVKKEQLSCDSGDLIYTIQMSNGKTRQVAARCFDVVGERYIEEAPFEQLGFQKISGPHDRDVQTIQNATLYHEPAGLTKLITAMLRVMTPEQLRAIKTELKI